MERYEEIKKLGAGNFGVAKLMRDKTTNDLVAMKFIARGPRIDENVAREIINHRALRHPNIVQFKKVLLTSTHLALVMEYAAGGELFDRICNAGRFSEDEARFFFQQLISGVSYIHSMKICHRDLKLENTLLDGGAAYRLKICDFGYSKSSVLHSRPTSTVGTPAYIAPEVVARKEYDGKLADVWSCGVTLYVMLVGAYPFEDPEDPKNFKKTIQRIQNVQYRIPEHVQVSQECRHLLDRIFVFNPEMRYTISDIKRHPWFLRNLPRELKEDAAIQYRYDVSHSSEQSNEEIMSILAEAKTIVQDKSMLDEEENEAEEEGEIYHDADVGGVSQQTDEEEDIVCYKSPEQKQEYAYQRKLGDMQRVIYHDKNWEARLQ